jgi:hypothetical protein
VIKGDNYRFNYPLYVHKDVIKGDNYRFNYPLYVYKDVIKGDNCRLRLNELPSSPFNLRRKFEIKYTKKLYQCFYVYL